MMLVIMLRYISSVPGSKPSKSTLRIMRRAGTPIENVFQVSFVYHCIYRYTAPAVRADKEAIKHNATSCVVLYVTASTSLRMMLDTMSLERYDREPEARYRNQTGSHLNDGLQPERRPQRLYLFCNGNRHFRGKVVLVNMRQYRNFGDFLSDVTNRLQPTLPLAHGIRQVFTPVNGRRLRRLSDLEDGRSYVCAGFETFKPMPYEDLTTDYKTSAPPIGKSQHQQT